MPSFVEYRPRRQGSDLSNLEALPRGRSGSLDRRAEPGVSSETPIPFGRSTLSILEQLEMKPNLPTIRLHSDELAPTQATIGAFEVRLKTDRFRLMSPRDLDGYLEAKREDGKPVAVVKGLHRYWVIDGHHTLSALLAVSPARVLHLELIDDFSDLNEDDFWARMNAKGYYLGCALGQAIEPADLPDRFAQLEDDPFRSVAWLVRKMRAYEDLKIPYQEFVVADFLRARMAFTPTHDHQYELAALRAFELVRSEAARNHAESESQLGFIDEPVPDGLLETYYQVLAKARAPRYYRR